MLDERANDVLRQIYCTLIYTIIQSHFSILQLVLLRYCTTTLLNLQRSTLGILLRASTRRAHRRKSFPPSIDGRDLIIIHRPLRHLSSRSVQLRLFRLRIITQIDRLRIFQRFITTPRLAPQPLLWKTVDGEDSLHVVRKILVQVR